MTEERKLNPEEARQPQDDTPAMQSRRDFLISLGKWSKVVIAGALLGSGLVATDRRAQAGGWINNRGGYGGSWVNRGGSWINGGGGWVNRGGSWINGGGGGGWVNRRGGGGYGWINR